jgi:hypothetical protein
LRPHHACRHTVNFWTGGAKIHFCCKITISKILGCPKISRGCPPRRSLSTPYEHVLMPDHLFFLAEFEFANLMHVSKYSNYFLFDKYTIFYLEVENCPPTQRSLIGPIRNYKLLINLILSFSRFFVDFLRASMLIL